MCTESFRIYVLGHRWNVVLAVRVTSRFQLVKMCRMYAHTNPLKLCTTSDPFAHQTLTFHSLICDRSLTDRSLTDRSLTDLSLTDP